MSSDNVVRVGANLGAAGNPLVDERSSTTSVQNGVTRIQFGTPGQDPNAPVYVPEQNRVQATDITRVTADGRTEHVAATLRSNTGTDTFEAKPGILATAMSASGNRTGDLSRPGVTVLLDPSDPNTRTPLATAVALGLVQRDPMGGFRETYTPQAAPAQAPAAQPQAQRQATPQETRQQTWGEHTMTEQSHKSMDLLNRTFGEAAVAENLVSAMVNGRVDVRHLSQAGDMSEDDVAKFVELGQATIALEMYQAMRTAGIADNDFNSMTDWAKEHHASEYKGALTELAHGRSTARIKALASAYLNSNVPTLEAINAQPGYRAWRDAKGVEFAQLPDGTIGQVKVLAKQGRL